MLHVVTHPWKLQCCHVVLVGYGPACPKFSEIKSPTSLERVKCCWFFVCSYLYHVRYPLKLKKICYFGLALSGIGFQPIRFSDVWNLKRLKTIWGITLIFCFHWSCKKICYFGWWLQNTLGRSVCKIFYFRPVWLVNLNSDGVHRWWIFCSGVVSVYFSTIFSGLW